MPSAQGKSNHKYTIQDIYNLPEGTRAELLDGKIYYMAPPSTQHQNISSEIHTEINVYIKSKKLPCKAFTAPFGVFLDKDDKKYVEPDISVICDPGKLDTQGCKGAPDWIIEIVSPSDSGKDYIEKLGLYKAAGVREYWIIDPGTELIHVYFFESNIFSMPYTFHDKIKVNICDDLIIDFAKLNI